jgi:hypothetical protein
VSGLTEERAEEHDADDRRRSFDVLLFVLLVTAGLVVAGVWRLLLPATTGLGDEQETQAAVDGTLALVQAVAGVLTAVAVLIRPGAKPALRTLVAIIGSAAAGAVSWQLGDVLGSPDLTAIGAAFIWPLATAVTIFLGAMLPFTSRRLNSSMPAVEHDDWEHLRNERSGPSGPS